MLTMSMDADNDRSPKLTMASCRAVPCCSAPAMGIIAPPAPQIAASSVVSQLAYVP